MWSPERRPAADRVLRGRVPRLRRAGREARNEFVPLGTRAGHAAGGGSRRRWGSRESVAVAVGNVDSFVSVPGAGVEQPGTFVMVVGTSICDMVVHPQRDPPAGDHRRRQGRHPARVCTATRPARRRWATCSPGSSTTRRRAGRLRRARSGRRRASGQARPGCVALDWWNGNRTILADADLTGAIFGLTLQTHARARSTARCWSRSRSATGGSWRTSRSTGSSRRADRGLRRDRRAQPADDAAARRHERTDGARSRRRARSRRAARRCSAPSPAGVFDDIARGDRGHPAAARAHLHAGSGGQADLRPGVRDLPRACTTCSAAPTSSCCTGSSASAPKGRTHERTASPESACWGSCRSSTTT